MFAGLLLLSLTAAVFGGVIAWMLAGFWWALAAYVGIGVSAVLLIGVARALEASRGAERSHPLVNPKAAG